MQLAAEHKLITCILPKGAAMPLLKLLIADHGLTAVDISFARGVGRFAPLTQRGVGETSEREMLTVAVPEEQADEVFESIYLATEMDQPGGGLMFMHALGIATTFVLPELPEEG